MTRRTVADEPKYYDFEIALTVDPIWCEEDEDGPRIDYRGDIRPFDAGSASSRYSHMNAEDARYENLWELRASRKIIRPWDRGS
jgi:hypothetical protein